MTSQQTPNKRHRIRNIVLIGVGLVVAFRIVDDLVEPDPAAQATEAAAPSSPANSPTIIAPTTAQSAATTSTTALPTTTSTTEAPNPATLPPTTVGSLPPVPVSNCDPNYEGACVPIAADVDCAGGSGNGPAYVEGPVRVVGSDLYGLDRDSNGVACE